MIKIFSLLFVFITITSIYCQKQYIDFYGTKIRLGMTEKELKDLIKFPYEFGMWENSESGVVEDKLTGKFVLSIGFENKRVSFVSRHWADQNEDTSMDFAKKIYSLFKKVESEGLENAIINTGSNSEAEYNVYQIWFVYGDKKITLSITEGENKNDVSLTEQLYK